MRLVLMALALTAWAVPLAAQIPGEPLVPTPNPVLTPLQVDLTTTVAFLKAMTEKYEGKYPGPAPRLPDGKPDLSGVWMPVGKMSRPDMTPLGLSILEQRFKTNIKDFPYSVCLPALPAPNDYAASPWEVVHTQTRLVTLYELPPFHRLVFLDGRPHPTVLDETWMGHSIGRWEGDVLVVDSAGFNDRSWLEFFLPHSSKLRIRERWTRPTMGTMVVERAYEDPDIFLKPWTMVYTAFLAPDAQRLENICENNRFKGR